MFKEGLVDKFGIAMLYGKWGIITCDGKVSLMMVLVSRVPNPPGFGLEGFFPILGGIVENPN